MDPATGFVAAELVKTLIMVAFEEARRRGMSEDQIAKIYVDELVKFMSNKPSNIPEV